MRLRASILGALALSVPLLLTACSDEAPPRQHGAISPPDTSASEGVASAPQPQPFGGVIGKTISESVAHWPDLARAPGGAPNILLIMIDDVGFAQLGSYGAHRIQTPHIDRLAEGGRQPRGEPPVVAAGPRLRSLLRLPGRHHQPLRPVAHARQPFCAAAGDAPGGATTCSPTWSRRRASTSST
jgi:hypothetical protein